MDVKFMKFMRDSFNFFNLKNDYLQEIFFMDSFEIISEIVNIYSLLSKGHVDKFDYSKLEMVQNNEKYLQFREKMMPALRKANFFQKHDASEEALFNIIARSLIHFTEGKNDTWFFADVFFPSWRDDILWGLVSMAKESMAVQVSDPVDLFLTNVVFSPVDFSCLTSP